MNDLIVQFARLWGQYESFNLSNEDQAIADELKAYDSEEMLSLLSGWAEEYLKADDVYVEDFFDDKVHELLIKPVKPANFAKTVKAIVANRIAIAAIEHGIYCDLDILTEYWDDADDYFMETYGCTVEDAESALDCKFAIRGNWGDKEASGTSDIVY